MRAGQLDRRIKVQLPVERQDGAGGAAPAWEDFLTLWARLEPAGGGEASGEGGVTAQRRAVWTIRWYPGIDETCRIVYEGQAWDIELVEEIGRKAGLRITAVAVDPK